MKNTKILAASAAALLSVGLVAAPVASANAQPPGPGNPAQGLSVDRAAWREARHALRDALMAARVQFHVDMKAAIATVKADTADEREALKAVLTDPAATDEQKAAARAQFKADTAEEREAFKTAVKDALVKRHAAVKAAWEAFRAAIA